VVLPDDPMKAKVALVITLIAQDLKDPKQALHSCSA